VDMPIIVQEVEEDHSGGNDHSSIDLNEISKNLEKLIFEHLDSEGIRFTEAEKTKLRKTLKENGKETKSQMEKGVRLKYISEQIAKNIVSGLKKFKSLSEIQESESWFLKIGQLLETQLIQWIVSQRAPPKRIKVSPLTHTFKELQYGEEVTRFKLSISESAIEWVSSEDQDGRVKKILLPE
jgi:hypothetical protein